jgi:DNA repair protein RadA/Sms
MSKKRTVFACAECGYVSSKWVGKCPACKAWDSLVEEVQRDEPVSSGSRSSRGKSAPVPISEISADESSRLPTGQKELDRILGGGLVSGSVILLGGEPGVGKSTLLLQVAHWLAQSGVTMLYVTAEESGMQLKLRAERLGCVCDNLLVLAENSLDAILEATEKSGAGAVIMDSIQMVFWQEMGGAPGSVGQVRECAAGLIAQAKRCGVPLFLVGHVTKEGSIAGPKVLEHMVDVVLSFEGDRFHAARILRSSKNRYGAANEVGVFEMTSSGLQPVPDPSKLFLSGHAETMPGTVVTAPLSGTRPFLVEVQALVAPTYPGSARRRVTGADPNRVSMLLAVLEKSCGLGLADQDVFLNVVGGAELREPGADLAMAMAVAGSLRELALPRDTVVIGEVGLGGEVRPVAQLESRLQEAARLGFSLAVIPADSKPLKPQIKTCPVSRIGQAMDILKQ